MCKPKYITVYPMQPILQSKKPMNTYLPRQCSKRPTFDVLPKKTCPYPLSPPIPSCGIRVDAQKQINRNGKCEFLVPEKSKDNAVADG